MNRKHCNVDWKFALLILVINILFLSSVTLRTYSILNKKSKF